MVQSWPRLYSKQVVSDCIPIVNRPRAAFGALQLTEEMASGAHIAAPIGYFKCWIQRSIEIDQARIDWIDKPLRPIVARYPFFSPRDSY